MPDSKQPRLSRRERLKIETTAEIKEIAREQMAEDGPGSISLRAIARQMGMSTPALYRYFPNYEALITELFVDAFNDLSDFLEAALASLDPEAYRERFSILGHAYRTWALDHPQDYLLINGSPVPGYTPPVDVTQQASGRSWFIFLSLLHQAYEAGALNLPDSFARETPYYTQLQAYWQERVDITFPIPVLHTALMAWTMCHGLVFLELHHRFVGVTGEALEIETEAFLSRIGL